MGRIAAIHALIHDGINAVVDLVEQTHAASADKPFALLKAVPGVSAGARVVQAVHGGIAGSVYDAIRIVNRGVEQAGRAALEVAEAAGLEQAVGQLEAQLDADAARELAKWTGTAQSALNAWIGDFLENRKNALSIELGLYEHGRAVPLTREALSAVCANATGKVCIFIHGLGCTDESWRFHAREQYGDPDASYGSFLARDLGYTPLYVRYNTGRHISANARALSDFVERLLAVYPREIEEIALIGHSMGGLVARGAAHYAQREQRTWVRRLTHVLCIGSPHLGAPLEQATHVLYTLLSHFDVAGMQVPAKLLNTRSAGIKDLRFGYVLDEDWTGKDPDRCLADDRNDVPLLDGVTYGFVAACFTRDPEHALGVLLGDLLVRIPSASGRGAGETVHVPFHLGEVVHGVHHIALLNHPEVYAQVRGFLAESRAEHRVDRGQNDATSTLPSPPEK